jgi:plastocyanin
VNRLLPIALLGAPAALSAQSLLDRPPNVSGDWVVSSGVVQFNFVHRFVRSGAPERKVTNFPTFVVALGLPSRTMIGFAYATNSTLAARYPNEWEFFARHQLFSELEGAPLDVGGQVGYNIASEGVDGEVSLAKRAGPARVTAAGRILADPFESGKTRFALGGGATLRITRNLALAGDASTLVNRDTARGERVAWSAGVHLAIPSTPHTLSLQATNTNTTTLQGVSRGESRTRFGFEYTVPITLARYFGRRQAPAAEPPPAEPPPAPVQADTARPAPAPPPAARPAARVVRVGMRNLTYIPKRIEITAGTAVAWRNDDPLAHTVTAVNRSFDSGLIDGGGTWRRTFDRPGTYEVFCQPHPFMKATIVVRPAP